MPGSISLTQFTIPVGKIPDPHKRITTRDQLNKVVDTLKQSDDSLQAIYPKFHNADLGNGRLAHDVLSITTASSETAQRVRQRLQTDGIYGTISAYGLDVYERTLDAESAKYLELKPETPEQLSPESAEEAKSLLARFIHRG